MTAYPIFRGVGRGPDHRDGPGVEVLERELDPLLDLDLGRAVVDDHAGVDRAAAALVEAEGVDVELDHARRLLEEPDDGEDRLHEPLLVARLHAAVAGDQGIAVDLADHAPDLGLVDREDPEGDVLHQLD